MTRMERILPGLIAVAVAAVMAVALLVPFVAISYRRRGGLTATRTLAWAGLLLWVLGVQAYTLLPVPSDDYTCAGYVLDPSLAVRDALERISHGGGIADSAVQQLVLNVALFVPWGVIVRMLWRRGVLVATLSGLGISLLVEFTQLTGVWGVFPCAYRLFDTADLVTNTLGALIGSVLALPFLRRRSVPLPQHVREITLGRRLLGMLCDVLAVVVTTVVVGVIGNAVQLYVLQRPPAEIDGATSSLVAALVTLVGTGIGVLATGSTIGEAAVRLRGVDVRHPVALWRAIRFLTGIGGYQLLTLTPEVGAWAGLAFAVVTVAVAWRSAAHRGLALIASGMRLELERAQVPDALPADGADSSR